VAARLVSGASGRCFAAAGAQPRGAAGAAEPLTGRELEVLQLLAAGRSNQRIARVLVVAS
jgi:DNA-binding CsgD family transcriptional regulator